MQIKLLSLKISVALTIIMTCDPVIAQIAMPKTLTWSVNGKQRKALVYFPSDVTNKAAPVIFAFHGHGGTMLNMYTTRSFQKLWPEAIVICPQGLNTVGLLIDPEGKKSGWVVSSDFENNRDLQFFDAMLKTLRTDYKVDDNSVYVTGHSNGGGFTYLLLASRANVFAAFAPTATAAGRLATLFKTPKPVFHLMGTTDPLVKPFMQKATYNRVLKLNDCQQKEIILDSNMILFPGKNGNDVQLFIHSGGHNYPKEANASIIDFFKKHRKAN